jgi:hypothetical protein
MRVYLDSMTWINFLESNPTSVGDVTKLMMALRSGGHTILSSFLVEAEVLVLPKSTSDHFTVASYERVFSGRCHNDSLSATFN